MVPANSRVARRVFLMAGSGRRSFKADRPIVDGRFFADKVGIDRRSILGRAGSAFSSLENLKPVEGSVKTFSFVFLNNRFSKGEKGIRPV
jgi:hypothetical protein